MLHIRIPNSQWFGLKKTIPVLGMSAFPLCRDCNKPFSSMYRQGTTVSGFRSINIPALWPIDTCSQQNRLLLKIATVLWTIRPLLFYSPFRKQTTMAILK